jgi:hypothetical protein
VGQGSVRRSGTGLGPRRSSEFSILMITHHLQLLILDERLAVCRLDHATGIPPWANIGGFLSITRTSEELSVVCQESVVPEDVKVVKGWRALRVVGTFEFSEVGILASLTTPLAEAGIGLFALSTFDTDYLLVQEGDLSRAIKALTAYGHVVRGLV